MATTSATASREAKQTPARPAGVNPKKSSTPESPTPPPAPGGPSPRDSHGLYFLGDANGNVLVEEWVCLDDKNAKQVDDHARETLRSHADVRVAFHHCPRQLAQSELDAAQALEAAGEEGRFWEALSWLLAKPARRTEQTYAQMARALDLDEEAFNAFRKSDEARRRVTADAGKLQTVAPPASSTITIVGKPVANLNSEAIEASVLEALK